MKVFLNELKQQWRIALYGRPYYGWQSRHFLKSVASLLNREVIAQVNSSKQNFAFMLGSVSVIILALLFTFCANDQVAPSMLKDVASVLLGLIVLFFTIAIFMATLSNEGGVRNANETAKFIRAVRTENEVFKTSYKALEPLLDDYQKIELMRAHAAESIFDQVDYLRFNSWLKAIEDDIKDKNNHDLKYSFDIDQIRQMVTYRTWPIKSASETIDTVLHTNDQAALSKHLLRRIEKLCALAESFDLTGVQNTYGQHEFLGHRLTRVVIYGFIGATAGYIYQYLIFLNHDLFPAYDLHTSYIMKFTLSLTAFAGLALAVRYLVLLLAYLRNQQPGMYYYVNIWPTDPTTTEYNSRDGQEK